MSSLFTNIQFHSSQLFSGTLWKTLVDDHTKTIFIESRDSDKRVVLFSAWHLETNEWIWKDVEFEEKWWISLGYVQRGTLLLTIYADANNPDKKSLLAVDVRTQKIQWWKNNFVVAYLTEDAVVGQDTKFGSKEITIDLLSGSEVSTTQKEFKAAQNLDVVRPLQYMQGTDHFETVRAFVERKCSFSPVYAVEYREYQSLIVISAFEGEAELANYLIVFNSEGDLLLKERLGENLKGIAYDTFFILSGFLIFVKNKRELISYRFV